MTASPASVACDDANDATRLLVTDEQNQDKCSIFNVQFSYTFDFFLSSGGYGGQQERTLIGPIFQTDLCLFFVSSKDPTVSETAISHRSDDRI
jgi:hypothetical protein